MIQSGKNPTPKVETRFSDRSHRSVSDENSLKSRYNKGGRFEYLKRLKRQLMTLPTDSQVAYNLFRELQLMLNITVTDCDEVFADEAIKWEGGLEEGCLGDPTLHTGNNHINLHTYPTKPLKPPRNRGGVRQFLNITSSHTR